MDIAHEAFQERLALMLQGSLIALIINGAAIQVGFYRRLPILQQRSTPDFGDVLFVFFIFFMTHLLLLPLCLYLWLSFQASASLSSSFKISDHLKIWINGIGIWVSALVMWAACKIFQPTTLDSIAKSEVSKKKQDVILNLGLGCLVWFVSYPAVLIINQLFALFGDKWFHPIHEDQIAVTLLKGALGDPFQLITYFIAIIFVVPIIEEFMFRGLLQRWLISKLGSCSGILLASLLFAGMHYAGAQGAYNFQLLPSLFVLSCYLGYLYERQGSLWASIALHAMFNFVSACMVIFNI